MNSYIKAEHLSYVYEDGDSVPALKGVSLSIGRGEYVAVVGHNGSGKSTFAKLLNLILVPTAGKLTVSGMDTVEFLISANKGEEPKPIAKIASGTLFIPRICDTITPGLIAFFSINSIISTISCGILPAVPTR